MSRERVVRFARRLVVLCVWRPTCVVVVLGLRVPRVVHLRRRESMTDEDRKPSLQSSTTNTVTGAPLSRSVPSNSNIPTPVSSATVHQQQPGHHNLSSRILTAHCIFQVYAGLGIYLSYVGVGLWGGGGGYFRRPFMGRSLSLSVIASTSGFHRMSPEGVKAARGSIIRLVLETSPSAIPSGAA